MIVVIDDNPTVCSLLVDRSKNISPAVCLKCVDSCVTAMKIIQELRNEKVPIEKLFVDMRLPGKNGIETIRKLRSDKLIESTVNVYLMTAFPEMVSMIDVRNLKVSGIIIKQFDYIGVLLSIMKE